MTDLAKCDFCAAPCKEKVPYPHLKPAPNEFYFTEIHLCAGCGLGKAFPFLTQASLDEFYRRGTFWNDIVRDNPFQSTHERVQSKFRVRECLPYLYTGHKLRVLDIGAGHAWTADWLNHFLHEQVSKFDFIEPDDDLSNKIMKKQLRFDLRRVATISDALEPYDLVFANHVLEHVADPQGFIRSIKQVMKPGGIAYVETPHVDYQFKGDVFPHTYFFTKKSFLVLARLLQVENVVTEEFGVWPTSSSSPWRKFGRFILSAAFYTSVKTKMSLPQELLDNAIWKYSCQDGGIWLRWIFRNS